MIDRKVLIPMASLLALVVGYLVLGNLNGDLVYYLTPSEAVTQQADFDDGQRFRLGGLVQEGSVVATQEGVRFVVDDGATEISVLHTGTPPQLFRENVGVVVEGSWQGDEFRSNLLLIRHDEEYRSDEDDPRYTPPIDQT